MTGQPQADGYYPRLNGTMLQSGRYTEMIVSMVGQFQMGGSHGGGGMGLGSVPFRCCDGQMVTLSTEYCTDLPSAENADNFVEVIGQALSPTDVAIFVVRPLTPDMNMELYNKMILIQQDARFREAYFGPPSTLYGSSSNTASPMASN